jgi:DNA polymerase zeta
MQLDASYYISRVLIPPLERVFNLVGADVRSWFDDMPKAIRAIHPNALAMSPKKQMLAANRFKIDEHFQSSQCLACGGSSSDGRHYVTVLLQGLTSRLQESVITVEEHLRKPCLSCLNKYERERLDL